MDGKPSASRSDGMGAAMNSELASDDDKACYAKRQQTIEPVFDHIKEQQGTAVPGLGACRLRRRVELLCGTAPAQVVAAPTRPLAAS
jgi:hypothetical protein